MAVKKLSELDGALLRIQMQYADRGAAEARDGIPPSPMWHFESDLSKAQGLYFLCPKCFEANGGKVGTHAVICWFAGRGVPDNLDPKPGRWTPSGTGLADLTFVPGDPPRAISVLLTSGCGFHGFVEKGTVRDA